jgi:hypothetical protein
MPISDDLFLAILATDAYNRKYNEGFVVSGNAIDTSPYAAHQSSRRGMSGTRRP